MLQDKEILQIPLENYVKHNSLIIIWCTNSDSHMNAIKNDFLPKWNLKLLTIWHWIKVDLNGETFCSFRENKKPYEKIFIATHKDNNNLHQDVPKDLLIFSNPSSIHSHKPPLIGKNYFNQLFNHFLIFNYNFRTIHQTSSNITQVP